MAKNKNLRDAEDALKKTHKPNHGMKEKKRHSNLQNPKIQQQKSREAAGQGHDGSPGGFGKDGNAPIAKPPSK